MTLRSKVLAASAGLLLSHRYGLKTCRGSRSKRPRIGRWQNHPQIRAVQYEVLAAGEIVRQVRSAYYPIVLGSVTGAEAQEGTRIAAGGLNNPTVLDRFAYGVLGSQMLTDLGRTSELTASATLRRTRRAGRGGPAGQRAVTGRSGVF